MKKTKKVVAFALTASMILASSITAFATDTGTTTSNSGNTSGTGSVEGHVDKEVLNVVLPTVEAGKSLFSYTMDPERLIQGTSAAKYAEGAVFPTAASDTGVYFLTGTNKYTNTSNAYQVINKSSCNVELIVKVKAETGTNNIALATTSTVESAEDGTPNLYLGLKVGEGGTATVLTNNEQEVKKTISGTPTNFDVAVKTETDGTKSYVYQAKDSADATGWKAMNISMEGAVSKLPITSTTTAPTVQVTWEYKKAETGSPAAVPAEEVLYKVTGPQMSVTTGGAISITGLTAAKNFKQLDITVPDGSKYEVNYNPVEWNMNNYSAETGGSLTAQLGTAWMGYLVGEGGNITLTLNLTEGEPVTASTTLVATK